MAIAPVLKTGVPSGTYRFESCALRWTYATSKGIGLPALGRSWEGDWSSQETFSDVSSGNGLRHKELWPSLGHAAHFLPCSSFGTNCPAGSY
jgi:hypothetical protein